MTLHALVAALMASSHRLGPAQFEGLRTFMRIPATSMQKMLRYVSSASYLSTRGSRACGEVVK